MERALGGSPWMVGRHALLLQAYDESVRPSEIKFDCMDIWIRILNLPLGWMKCHRGERAMGLVGAVKKMDMDRDGKASGAFLRARVAIEIAKPLRRGVLLKTKCEAEPEWFELQYEKLPFYCLSCGIMGHSELECDKPVIRSSSGKLPYDIKLRAPEVNKKKVQNFTEAAAESFGSGSSAASKQSRSSMPRSDPKNGAGRDDEEEVLSPLKNPPVKSDGGSMGAAVASRELFPSKNKDDFQIALRKRKAKGSVLSPSVTPDLNVPALESAALVPAGLVTERVNQLGKSGGEVDANASEVSRKKQKRSKSHSNAISAAAASGSPRRAQ